MKTKEQSQIAGFRLVLQKGIDTAWATKAIKRIPLDSERVYSVNGYKYLVKKLSAGILPNIHPHDFCILKHDPAIHYRDPLDCYDLLKNCAELSNYTYFYYDTDITKFANGSFGTTFADILTNVDDRGFLAGRIFIEPSKFTIEECEDTFLAFPNSITQIKHVGIKNLTTNKYYIVTKDSRVYYSNNKVQGNYLRSLDWYTQYPDFESIITSICPEKNFIVHLNCAFPRHMGLYSIESDEKRGKKVALKPTEYAPVSKYQNLLISPRFSESNSGLAKFNSVLSTYDNFRGFNKLKTTSTKWENILKRFKIFLKEVGPGILKDFRSLGLIKADIPTKRINYYYGREEPSKLQKYIDGCALKSQKAILHTKKQNKKNVEDSLICLGRLAVTTLISLLNFEQIRYDDKQIRVRRTKFSFEKRTTNY